MAVASNTHSLTLCSDYSSCILDLNCAYLRLVGTEQSPPRLSVAEIRCGQSRNHNISDEHGKRCRKEQVCASEQGQTQEDVDAGRFGLVLLCMLLISDNATALLPRRPFILQARPPRAQDLIARQQVDGNDAAAVQQVALNPVVVKHALRDGIHGLAGPKVQSDNAALGLFVLRVGLQD